MLIKYLSDGRQLFARVYDESGYNVYTCGRLGDGSAEKGIEDLHWVLLNSVGFKNYHKHHAIKY